HPQQLAGEEGGFRAAGTRADLDKDVLLIVRVAGKEHYLQVALQLRQARLELAQLGGSELAEIGIGVVEERAGVPGLAARVLVLAEAVHERREFRVRLAQRLEA